MDVQKLFLLQFIAHLLLDYFLQTDKLAIRKNTDGFRSGFLYWHTFLCFLLAWIFSLQLAFVAAAAFIAITHFLLDGFKNRLIQSPHLGKYAFYIDQALHLLILAVAVVAFGRWHGIESTILDAINIRYLLIISGYLICFKPANIFIKEIFKSTEIQVSSDNEMPNAGMVIGILERILTLTLILVSQYSAVGFLIAAKSILRYRNDETLKTEYVLIGTLLSFGIAVIAGILINAY